MTRVSALSAIGVTRTLTGEVPVTLVRDANLTFMPGEFAAITGPSGSGKSSLLYLLGLLDRPDQGRVEVMGRDTSGLGADQLADIRLESMGFVFQFHFLLPEFDALNNVAIPMRRLGKLPERQIRDRAAGLLDGLGLGEHSHKLPDQMSGGQRQRVAIARALANDPAVILADEPTGNLDSLSAQLVFSTFRDLAARDGRTVIVVTHDHDLAATTDRQVHLVDGRVVS